MSANKSSQSCFVALTLLSLLLFPSLVHAKTYTLGLVEWMPWATAYVAAEKGFWQQEGIDVKIIQYDDYDTGDLQNFQFGEIDFALLMLASVVDIYTRAPLYSIIYEHDWSHGGDVFILGKELKTLEQLKGKTIGVYSKSTPIEFFLQQILAGHDLTLADISLRQIANTKKLNRALANKVVHAIISYDPEASVAVRQNLGRIINSTADFPGVLPEGIAVQRHILEENRNDVRSFLRGWLRAVKWQSDPANQEEYFAILNRTMFKNNPRSKQEFLQLATGGKIHRSLETIEARNSSQAAVYVLKIFDFLGKPMRQVLATDIAVDEARKIYSSGQ